MLSHSMPSCGPSGSQKAQDSLWHPNCVNTDWMSDHFPCEETTVLSTVAGGSR